MAKMIVDIEISLVADSGEHFSGHGYYEEEMDGEMPSLKSMFRDGALGALVEAAECLERELEAEMEGRA